MLSFIAMRTRRRIKHRPSKEQVRAWLTTVIAPVARALAVERERINRSNWSFRCETQDFEFLWPVEKMVAVQYLPNLEQLLRYRSDLKKCAQEHDRALANLLSAARLAYRNVIQHARFLALAASVSVAESDRKYLAAHIVNGIRDLASYYVHHDLWTREGGKFLDLREDPELLSDFRSLSATGREVAEAVDVLRSSVVTFQVEFADEYRLPPVDPVDARI